MIALERLEALLAGFPGLTIGLVGDLFLDRYLDIDPDLRELSVETGLEAYQISRVRNSPGALGTILNNLAALGVGRLVPVTVIGDDGQAYDLLKALARLPVGTEHILQDAKRNTPTYTKPLRRDADGIVRELNRLDLRNRASFDSDMQARLLDRITRVWNSTAGLIVLDQVNEEGWGVVTPAVRTHLAELARRDPDKLMFVDSRAHIQKFQAGVLKPNLAECRRAVGMAAEGQSPDPAERDAEDQRAVGELARRTELTLFCTRGEQGMLIAEPGRPVVKVSGYPVTGPIDVVGAGDSATSGIVASLLVGATLPEAADLGNLVASITVQQLGTTGTASPEQLRARWHETHA
ncbi:MAG: carbohydrate kinase [Planctomycetaceae bacterium]|nr:carbohydrate kinase [Planctomycetaceae bacterium]